MNTTQIERLLIEYSNIPERRKELDIKIKEVEFLKQNTENTLKAPSLDGMPHGNELRDAVLSAVQKIVDEYQIHLDYYRGQLGILNSTEKAMYEALKALEPHEHKVVELRYFKGYRWENIALRVNYHRNQCMNIKEKAIEKIAQIYEGR